MNFFGHAILAAAHRQAQSFVVGAMLPDLVSMAGSRRVPACPEPMSAGIAFHYLTDELFHGAPAFRGLEREAALELASRGLRRGSARAVAHVGTELLIDAVLGRDDGSMRSYLGAVAWARSPAALAPLVWTSQGDAARLTRVMLALAERGAAVADARPAIVAARVGRVLQHRPRLALSDGDLALVETWVARASGRVEDATGTLLRELTLEFQRRGVALTLLAVA